MQSIVKIVLARVTDREEIKKDYSTSLGNPNVEIRRRSNYPKHLRTLIFAGTYRDLKSQAEIIAYGFEAGSNSPVSRRCGR